jgi:hypothetical protein
METREKLESTEEAPGRENGNAIPTGPFTSNGPQKV